MQQGGVRRENVYKPKYLPSFDADLAEAEDYLFEYSPPAADALAKTLDEQMVNLIDYPFMYPVYSGYVGNKEYRIMPLPYQFLCFYTVDEDDKIINMYRILHSTRNIPRIL